MKGQTPLEQLESLLRKLPGVGEKSARRIAMFIVRAPAEYSRALAGAIQNAKQRIRECRRCRNYDEQELCAICSDSRRHREILCVVAGVSDLQAIERSCSYRGTYYVLHGNLAPLDGVEPDDLKVERLVKLVVEEKIKEVVIATNPSAEGEATAAFLGGKLRPLGVKISRIAFGVPHGGELEYADPVSIKNSIDGRREY